MKRLILLCLILAGYVAVQAKTLVVYYSYTNNVNRIVAELTKQIEADVIRVQPAEKGVDYAANNYAIGSAQISAIRNKPNDASSYPAIDSVKVNLAEYDCVIIGAPLWWSNMAAPLQTFLFHHGKDMAGKKIGLIVSSASSGISGVESDAKRLIPKGDFMSPSLWIRSSQTSNAASMVSNWLKAIGYDNISGINDPASDSQNEKILGIFNLSGQPISDKDHATNGIYIVQYINGNRINTKKVAIR